MARRLAKIVGAAGVTGAVACYGYGRLWDDERIKVRALLSFFVRVAVLSADSPRFIVD